MTMMGFRFFKQCQQCHKNVFILYNFSVNCLKTDILQLFPICRNPWKLFFRPLNLKFKPGRLESKRYFQDLCPGFPQRARDLAKLEVEPFRSKTLLPGSMPVISAARARASRLRLGASCLDATRYFRDLCPRFPRRARAFPK